MRGTSIDREYHKNIAIQAVFPGRVTLGYLIHPAISTLEEVSKLPHNPERKIEVNITELESFLI